MPPDYVDLLIEFHRYASRRGFLREIEETQTARLLQKASRGDARQGFPSMEALSNAVRTKVAGITDLLHQVRGWLEQRGSNASSAPDIHAGPCAASPTHRVAAINGQST